MFLKRECCASGLVVLAALLLPTTPAFAQWTGKGQVGAALASGNDDTMNVNGKGNVKHVQGAWEENLGAIGVYAANKGDTTSQMWELFGDGRYNFNARNYWFGSARYQTNRFSGFHYQGSVSAGVGRKFTDTERVKLQGRIGAGFKLQETRSVLDALTGVLTPRRVDNSAAAVAGLDWDFKATSTTTLYNYFYVESGSQNTFLRNESGVSVAMSQRLALALAYTARHNTGPPAGFKRTDTLLTANLVYEVK
jgi:putative salt-induced outer membrane protein